MSDPVGTEKSKAATEEKASSTVADVDPEAGVDETVDRVKAEDGVTDVTVSEDSAADDSAARSETADDEAAEGAGKAEEARPLTKAEKRELLRVETQRARARKAGMQAFGLATAGLAVVAVIIGVLYFADSRQADPVAETPATTTPAEEPSLPPAVPFPPVPEGADPALKTAPTVAKGDGKLEAGKPKITYLIRGTGPATKTGDLITANYVGVLYGTGEEFDSSWSRQEAITFTIGQGQLIDGWEKGLMDVPVGSRIILDLPPDLAYGDQDDGSGRPTGDLRFVVDVLGAQGQ